jgi:hypothetical protein
MRVYACISERLILIAVVGTVGGLQLASFALPEGAWRA